MSTIFRSRRPRVLILFDGESLTGKRTALQPLGLESWRTDPTRWLLWCGRWVANRRAEVLVMLPEEAKPLFSAVREMAEHVPVIWYGAQGSVELPQTRRGRDTLIVNGFEAFIPWDDGQTEARGDSDLLVMGTEPSLDESRYSESVQVDETGRVTRFIRHYSDSRRNWGHAIDSVKCLLCADEYVDLVIGQILSRGWGLESVGALTQRLRIRWSELSARPSQDGFETGGSWFDDPRQLLEAADPDASFAAQGRVDTRVGRPAYRFVKRGIDIVFSSLALLLLSPLLLVVSILVKCTSRGPVFFAERRQGLRGREFQCLKFRTMIQGADALQTRLRERNEVDGPQFKIANDPRLTILGGWLRKFNIDELPQFFNVLRGDMSLVGPRPSPDRENQYCPGWRRARLSVRPGITGLWQVLRLRENEASDFQQWIYYDMEYVRHRSLWLDWQLLWHTPMAMFASSRLGRFARRLEQRGICVYSPRIRRGDALGSFLQFPTGAGSAEIHDSDERGSFDRRHVDQG